MSRRRVKWPIWVLTRLVLPIVILTAIGGGILYVRLLNGPISLKSIAPPIARALTAELPGFDVAIDDTSVQLSEGMGLEFRLRNVKLSDQRGVTVAQAPDAAVTLSTPALWSGRIAPSRIILIEPSLVLQYSRERGVSLEFTDATGGQVPVLGAPPQSSDSSMRGSTVPVGASPSQSDIAAALSQVLAQAGQAASTASFIKGIGLRNATLAIDSAGQRTVLRVREADVGVDRRREGSMIGASLSLESARGLWGLTLVATRDDNTNAMSIDTRVTDLVPRALANAGAIGPLSFIDLPLNGSGSVQLSGTGEVSRAQFDIDLGRGAIAPGWRGNGRMPIEGGRISLNYDPAGKRLGIATTRIASGASWATFGGGIAFGSEAGKPWLFDIASIEGQIAAPEFGQGLRPLDAFRMRGTFDTQSGILEIAGATLKAAGGEIMMSGTVTPPGSPVRMLLQGRMSPMGVDALKLLWPSVVAPHARHWSGNQVQQGRLTSGTFTVEELPPGPERARFLPDGVKVSVAIEGSGVRIQPKPGFAPVEAPRALIRLDGHTLEVAAPDATIITSPQRRLQIRAVRMLSNDIGAANAVGDLTFRAQGALPAALDLAEQQAARNGRAFVVPGEGLDGKVDAQVRIIVPLGDDLTADDTRIDIKGRVTEGKARNIFSGWDVGGSNLAIDVSDQQLEVKGDLLVAGVTAKVMLKRIFAAAEAEQPPVLISANLDTADRVQLGLDINEFVVGELPVEILVSPRLQGESQVQVRANLTNAELVLEALAWKKAQGRPATLQFEIARPTKQRTELQGFRIVGEDISLSGSIVLDQRNKVREFGFPELALHVVSRLQLSGYLRPDNVWDVTVRGQTLDGRDFFQSLFSVGQVRSKPLPPRKDQTGLDLKAEIDNVLGHQDLALKNLSMQMTNRGGRTVSMRARGVVDGNGRAGGTPLDVMITQAGRDARRLNARAGDAGQVFRMIGFFPNMLGGSMNLDVDLDGTGAAEKTGRLHVSNFAILGDPVAGDSPDMLDSSSSRGQRRSVQRSRLDFDSMNAPFELGHGQVVIRDADLRGQVLGVVITGKADFRSQYVDLGGTYVPLQGLNSAVGQFPLLGQILAGPRGEGVIGMTFAVKGPMSRPQVVVNPASIIPGILREMMQISNQNPRITPRDAQPASEQSKAVPKKAPPVKSSSVPGSSKPGGATTGGGKVDPEGGWSSPSVKGAAKPAPRPQ